MIKQLIPFPLLPGPQTPASPERGRREGSERSAPASDIRFLEGHFIRAEARPAATRAEGHWTTDEDVGEPGGGEALGGVAGRSLRSGEGDAAGSGSAPAPVSTYLAQHISQEVLPEGLYIDPHPAGIAAYRDVLGVVAFRPAGPSGFDLRV